MDDKDRKLLERNAKATEDLAVANRELTAVQKESNALTRAVLKASGKQPPRRPTEQGERTLTDETMSKYVDGARC